MPHDPDAEDPRASDLLAELRSVSGLMTVHVAQAERQRRERDGLILEAFARHIGGPRIAKAAGLSIAAVYRIRGHDDPG